jgi:hypothetical protein
MSFGSAKNMVRRFGVVKKFNTLTYVILHLSNVSTIDGTAALPVEGHGQNGSVTSPIFVFYWHKTGSP